MTVIIYTGNKVKSNRGEEKKKGFNWIFLFWSAYNIRENILHLVDIIDENIPKFCTFVTDIVLKRNMYGISGFKYK